MINFSLSVFALDFPYIENFFISDLKYFRSNIKFCSEILYEIFN